MIVLQKFYTLIFNYGITPNDFNVSIETPIPKISSCFANVLEHIIVQNIGIRNNVYLASLDTQKAFDKLWRTGNDS
ncbi:hypothetical protein BpHYR1_054270 [Brachionus plicatilis]|uniref:Uncharacterized protein n=1 Tax=Brachionus plicatilis TaxID=10195 RepID=A0A3M7R653_BRAPC|nr:hypothetical protein BpHYR1_054270 [Brachionus plicatilis]